MNSALRTRAKLCEAQVIEIFQLKKSSSTSSVSTAALVAKSYEISEKAVRDIWAGRTWTKETSHLDTTRILFQKRIGRPKGCRDSRPRTAKAGRKKLSHVDSERPGCVELRYNPAERLGKKVEVPAFKNKSASSSVSTVEPDQTNLLSIMPTVPHSLTPKALPSPSNGVPSSVDQQLHEWTPAFWIEDDSADPFHADWDCSGSLNHRVSSGPARA